MKLRLTSLVLAIALLPCAIAAADDKPVPAAPVVNPVYTPTIPPVAPAPLTEAQVEAIVDRAIQRTLDARNQQQPAITATVPAPATVHYAVPPGPIRSGIARVGQRLAKVGEPKIKPLHIVPAPQSNTAAALMFSPAATPQNPVVPLASLQAR